MSKDHLPSLDGWRGISILAVLACHLLPLGPKSWHLNYSAGLFGMAIFFTLSGFLITTFLLKRADVRDFLIRRICRIVPLAWAALTVGLLMAHAPADDWLPNFLFCANIPPLHLTVVTSHFWSLCVEMQFYAFVALIFGLFGKRGLLITIPACALAVTAWRVAHGIHESIVTYERVDEIFAGGMLALVYAGELGRLPLGSLNPWVLLAVYCLSTTNSAAAYFRPYLAAALVGSTLMGNGDVFGGLLKTKALAYVAQISYALYIVHPLLADTWLGTGTKIVAYLKRPLLFLSVFLVAHISTFYYEARWIAFGKSRSTRRIAAQAV